MTYTTGATRAAATITTTFQTRFRRFRPKGVSRNSSLPRSAEAAAATFLWAFTFDSSLVVIK